MRALRLTSPVTSHPGLGSRWSGSGPECVYDGYGIETEPVAPGISPLCLSCSASMVVDLGVLPGATSLSGAATQLWVQNLATAFGLTIRDYGELRAVVDPLGLSAYLLEVACSCGALHAVVLGYGEYQPVRWVGTFVGIARATSDQSERAASTAMVAAIMALVVVAAVVIGAHVWAWSVWRTGAFLQAEGAAVPGVVVDSRTAQGPRSDGYWVTVRFDVDGSVIEGERSVDRATFDRVTREDVATIRYDRQRPDRFDIDGNDRRSNVVFILVVVDLFIIVAAVRIARDARGDRSPV